MRKHFPHKFIVKALVCLTILFTVTLMFNSCKKDSKTSESENSEIATTKKPGTGRFPGPCPYTCEDPRCSQYQEPPPGCSGGGGGSGTAPKPMTAIFQNINYTQLQQLLNANDSVGIENFFYPLALQIANQIEIKYGEDISDEIGDFPQAMVLLGLFEYGKENNISLDEQTLPKNADPFDCFSAALGGILGIPNLVDIYNDFKHGVSPRTILRTLKSFGKRIFTAIAIGWAIVELGDCLDWW